MGIHLSIRSVILQCIYTSKVQVLRIGELTEEFSMERGVRQDCPLSPYIFVLCVEQLSHFIDIAIGERN